jgi:type III secretion protein Q
MNHSVIEPLAARLTRSTATDAAAARLLGSARLHAQLAQWLPGLALWGTQTPAAPQTTGRRYGFGFTGPAGEIVVTVPDTFSGALTATMTAADWPESLRVACVERLLEASAPPVAAWLKCHGFSLHTLGVDLPLPAGAEAVHGLIGSAHVSAALRCTDSAWPALALAGFERQRVSALASVARLPAALTVAFGRRRMAMKLLRTLAAGDVLVLPLGAMPGGGIERGLLVSGARGASRLGLACRVHGTQLTIQGDDWMSEHNTMNAEAAPATLPPGSADPLAEIEVELHLELQVISTPIGELANMRTGYVLELPMAAQDASVDLVVGGQLFGRAQLVCVGDKLGARIIELRHDTE